ncbi:CDP-alcohol phosphatidyltransferase family protein [Actinotalea sp. BY-33]|uniref:CDP-alcohol phosphatidyltransferase family protein n=1 Tax=Actinotalea soli TaxID=2819234 RepID=A0A939RS60_9CELL|nr:CDP-alcohol phosphatidyltransferase family protein [Actinotalea soli]MBO1750292.1 CDP-alcohol phosphatidyltransferase family protein [Actinotalea soli]
MAEHVLERRTPARDVIAALRLAQKPSAGTPAYSRWVNRPLARRVTAFAFRAGLTPNGATAISAVLSTAAIALVALADPTPAVGGGIALLLATGYVWDSVDGQLARLTATGSPRGEWLDHTVDCVKTTALHLAVLVSFYRHPSPDAPLLLPLAYTLVATVLYFGLILTPKLRRAPAGPRTASRENPWRPWLLLPTDYGALCLAFLTFGARPLFSLLYGLFAVVTTLVLLAAWRKWWRELGAAHPAA